MEVAPNNVNNEDISAMAVVWKFLVKNFLGILSVIFGVTMKVHLLRGKMNRMSKWQCRVAVFIAGLSGAITWYLVKELPVRDFYKAIITGYIPIVIEPITIRCIVWIDPIIDEAAKTIKKYIKTKSE